MSVLYSAQLVFMTKGVTVSEFWDNTYQKPLWYIPKLNVSGVLTIFGHFSCMLVVHMTQFKGCFKFESN